MKVGSCQESNPGPWSELPMLQPPSYNHQEHHWICCLLQESRERGGGGGSGRGAYLVVLIDIVGRGEEALEWRGGREGGG